MTLTERAIDRINRMIDESKVSRANLLIRNLLVAVDALDVYIASLLAARERLELRLCRDE